MFGFFLKESKCFEAGYLLKDSHKGVIYASKGCTHGHDNNYKRVRKSNTETQNMSEWTIVWSFKISDFEVEGGVSTPHRMMNYSV